MKVKLVADSSANFHTLPGLEVSYAPLKIVAGETEYVDTADLDVPAMMAELKNYKGKSSSSCPSVQDWLDTFDGADMVLGVAISSGISGSYNAAQLAIEEYTAVHPDAKIFILDSRTAGSKLQLVLEKYRELLDRGLDFDAIREAILDYHAHTHLFFCLESMDNFAKNGRISPLVAKAVGLLGIRIIGQGSAEGKLEPLHKCRGAQRATAQMYKSMLDRGFRGGKVRITHSLNPNGAKALADLILADYPKCDLVISENRGLCSYYAEAGGVLVGFEC